MLHRTKSSRGRRESDRTFETRKRVFGTLSDFRYAEAHDEGPSLTEIAQSHGTTVATIQNYAPAALRKSPSGRWRVTKDDPYVRTLSLPGPHGPVVVRAHGYSEAQFASAYLASLERWAHSEKSYELAPFRGKTVGDFELVTSPRTLKALRDAGLLQLDSLYAALKDVA